MKPRLTPSLSFIIEVIRLAAAVLTVIAAVLRT
ncbi:hypothetical protein QOZ96_000040 [Brevundimonas nasdae]|nr:hypothetical protein [Brevundimonas nasdae]